MFLRAAIAVTTLSILVAIALAFVPWSEPGQASVQSGETLIEKNSNWPLRGHVTMHPCATMTCQEV